MHLYFLMPIIVLWQSAQAGVFFTEEEYRDLADVVVIAEVVEADCLNVTESDTVRITDFQATLLVQNATKGTIDGDRILLVSSTYDYGDEMDCSDPGSVHPVGEVATYHLKETDTAGTYTNIDAGRTFEADQSTPDEAPICDEDTPNPPDNDTKSCAIVAPVHVFGLWIPISLGLVRLRRKGSVNSTH